MRIVAGVFVQLGEVRQSRVVLSERGKQPGAFAQRPLPSAAAGPDADHLGVGLQRFATVLSGALRVLGDQMPGCGLVVERDRVFDRQQGITLRRRHLAEGRVGTGAGHERGIDQTVRPRGRIEHLSRFEQFGPFPGLQVNLDLGKVRLRFERNPLSQHQRLVDLFVACGGQRRLPQRIGLLLRLGCRFRQLHEKSSRLSVLATLHQLEPHLPLSDEMRLRHGGQREKGDEEKDGANHGS